MTILLLEPIGESFSEKRINLTTDIIKVGRKISAKNPPEPYNGIFESKVLSRTHAEIWNDKGKILIKDVGSSNGTFINGKRISEEGQPSASFELHTGDILEFGIDIKNEEGDDILYRKVSAKVKIMSDDSSSNYSEVLINFETILDKQIEKAESTQSELKLIRNIISDLTSKIESIPPTFSKKKILMELDEAHNQERLWIDKYTNLLKNSRQNEKDLELLKADNQNLIDDAEYTKCQLEISEDRVKELEEKQSFYEKENQIVKDEYAKMRNDYKDLSDKLEREERQNEKFKKRISDLEENCSKIKYENIDNMDIAQDKVAELNKKIEELNKTIEYLEMEKKDIIVSKNDIRDELNLQKIEFNKKINDWIEKEKQWNEGMNNLKDEIDNKNHRNDELSKEIQELKEEIKKENKELIAISNNNKNITSLENNCKHLKEENEKLKKTIEEEKQKGRANLKEWNSFKNKLTKDNESLIKEKDTLSKQLKELQQWKLEKEKEISSKKLSIPSASPEKDFSVTKSIDTNDTTISNTITSMNVNTTTITSTVNRKNKNRKNKKDNNKKEDTKTEPQPEPIKQEDKEKDEFNNDLNHSLAASSQSSLATINLDDEKQAQIGEEENVIMRVMKTVVIPLVMGILFSVLFNYFFIHDTKSFS